VTSGASCQVDQSPRHRVRRRWSASRRVSALRRYLAPAALPGKRCSGRQAVLAVTAIVAGTVAILLRTGGHGALDTLWAEDARNFVSDAFDRPFLRAVVTPINGYLLVFPRILVEPVTLLPPEWAAAVISTEVALVCSTLAVIVFVASGAQLNSIPVRVLVAGVLVLAPVGQGGVAPGIAGSVVDNVATLQFPLTYTVFWLLLWSPGNAQGRVVAVGTTLLTSLSTMLTVVYLPWALCRVLLRRDRYGIGMLASLVIGAAVQLGVSLTGYAPRAVGRVRLDPAWVGTEYVRWLVPNALLGEQWWMETSTAGRVGLAVLAWAAIALFVGLAAARLTSAAWVLAGIASGFGLAFVAVELLTFGVAADRYTYLPGLLLLAALAVIVSPARRPRLAGLAPLAAYVALLALVCAVNFQVPNQRANALSWSAGVRAARQQCRVPGVSIARVQTHPSRHWAATIACAKLR
jgi:hypothetical protein